MISCFIIDDEEAAIALLKNFIDKTPFLKLEGSTTDPVNALQILQNLDVKLIFMDVQMPALSGVELMKMLPPQYKVVLTTASNEYAVEGFEQDALDYLLKPIPFERFLKTAQKALNAIAFDSPKWQSPAKEDEYLFVKTENKGKMIKINFDEILYIEGLKNYVSIYTKESRIITLLNIKDLEERLHAKSFLRVHKSYIVSLEKIKAVDGNQILLKDVKASVPLGETYRSFFFKTLEMNLVGGKR